MNRKWSERYATLPAGRRETIDAEVSELLREMPLHELRRARQLSQEQLATLLGEKQSSISKLEQRTDMYVSTLRRYLEAMGGELVIAARFPTGAIEITKFGALDLGSADAAASGVAKSRVKEPRVTPASKRIIGVKLGRAPKKPVSSRKKK